MLGPDELFLRMVAAVAGGDDLTPMHEDGLSPETVRALLAPLVASPAVAVEWSAVNGNRVDLGVTSSDDREWRIAYTSDDGERLRSLHVFERPPVFPGVAGGRAIVVHGPSSAGKSTLMHAISAAAGTPWVVFDEASFGSYPMTYAIWPETAPTLREGFVAGIAALAASGNQVVTSSGQHAQGVWRDAFAAVGVPVLFVGLECPVDVLVARQGGRDDRWGGLAESTVGVHEGWSHDLVLDSSAHTPDEL
ncbi:MAG TPA: hypothetical protein VF230_14220, partial [Acidimicrobiales bacterium]